MKKINKLLAVVLSVIMILSAMSVIPFTASAERIGVYTYTIENSEAIITDVSDVIEGDVIIPEYLGGYKVVGIGESAFNDCNNITSVLIPESIRFISETAFSWCTGITDIEIQAKITRIETSTFYGCRSLKSIVLPNTITYIGDMAFELTEILNEDLWDGDVLYIGNYLIRAKNKLSGTYTVKDGTRIIANDAFSECLISKVILPKELISIGGDAFYSCINLKIINIPDSVNYIGNGAFSYCYNLKNVVLPNSISEVSEAAFAGCTALTSIVIPESVNTICQDAFFDCENLRSIILGNGITEIQLLAFYGCENIKSIIIPEGVLLLGYGTFAKCKRLETLYLPASLKELNNSFDSCDSLIDIYYSGNENQKSNITGIENEYYLNTSNWHYNSAPACYHTKSSWKTIKNSTLTETGLKQEICTECGKVLGEEVIPKLTETYSLETAKVNEAENISVAVSEGSNLPETAEIVVQKAEVTESSITYDIHIENGGIEVQPGAPVLVKIPIPAGFDKSKLNVFRKEQDGSKTRMDIIIDGDYAYFETDHFSIYEIIEKLCGDINGDDNVNNKDLTRMFQYLSDWEVEVNADALDVNGDGKVNNKDLTRLFQYLSDWNVEIY